MSDVRAIDTLFPIILKDWFDSWKGATNSPGELHCMVENTWKPFSSPEEIIAEMDRTGVESVLATDLLAWSYKRQARFAKDYRDKIYELSKKYPGRIYGLADYNPLNISESLRELERDVRDRGFVGVYVHIYGFDIPLDDRRMYPLYAKAEELGVPVQMQTGYVLEAMPSEHGRPIALDRISLDFPDLVLVGTHTGYPWVDELISVSMKLPKVYVSISAWLPKYFHPSLVSYLKSKISADKVIFGSNGLAWGRYLDQMKDLGLPEESLRKILYDNAKRIFKLDAHKR